MINGYYLENRQKEDLDVCVYVCVFVSVNICMELTNAPYNLYCLVN